MWFGQINDQAGNFKIPAWIFIIPLCCQAVLFSLYPCPLLFNELNARKEALMVKNV
jgi:hypothetical protein